MTEQAHPVSLALAPWTLQADSWVFPHWTSSAERRSNEPTGLTPGSVHPMESASVDHFQGGPGGWMLYRYSDSPVGPYDELIHVAGVFDEPGVGKGLRITNIYVSSDESIYNGRRNWNIPKHKARFEWSHAPHTSSSEAQTVSVYHPSDSPLASAAPFFAASLQPSAYCPNIPLNTTYSFLPSLFLYQPPLRPSKYKHGSRLESLSATTDTFLATAPTFSGAFHLARLAPAPGRSDFGDGVSFPRLPPGGWRLGVHLPRVQVGFPEPVLVKAKQA